LEYFNNQNEGNKRSIKMMVVVRAIENLTVRNLLCITRNWAVIIELQTYFHLGTIF
jgi:hypothetical protein